MHHEGYLVPEPERAPDSFGTTEYLTEYRDDYFFLLQNAQLIDQRDIDEVRPELTNTHSNQVLMTTMDFPSEQLKNLQTSNSIKFFQIYHHGQSLIGIYKPKSGENRLRLREFSITQMYTREFAAYMVDYYAELGIVPPTIIREVNGDIGSLQLYIPASVADIPTRVSLLDREKCSEVQAGKNLRS